MKKKLLLAPLMAALVACVVLLSGCGGPSVEELITNDLTSQFDEIKNGGDDFLSGLEEASGDEFEQLGIDPKEYAKSYLEGFDYKIGDVTVDEDKGTATAEVTITCKSMNKIVEDFATQYQEKVAALDTMPSECWASNRSSLPRAANVGRDSFSCPRTKEVSPTAGRKGTSPSAAPMTTMATPQVEDGQRKRP